MDKITPPERRMSIDPKCAKIMLRELHLLNEDGSFPRDAKKKVVNIDKFWGQLSECRNYRLMNVMGVYIKDIDNMNDSIKQEIKQELRSKNMAENIDCAIFLCPERIKKWCVQDHLFPLAFAKVLFHELAHAYFQFPDGFYNADFGRCIEESLANAFAYRRFITSEQKELKKLMASQPIEYAAYVYWDKYQEKTLHNVAYYIRNEMPTALPGVITEEIPWYLGARSVNPIFKDEYYYKRLAYSIFLKGIESKSN